MSRHSPPHFPDPLPQRVRKHGYNTEEKACHGLGHDKGQIESTVLGVERGDSDNFFEALLNRANENTVPVLHS
jgi:hypothetical protein